jgi:hypothetical protein
MRWGAALQAESGIRRQEVATFAAGHSQARTTSLTGFRSVAVLVIACRTVDRHTVRTLAGWSSQESIAFSTMVIGILELISENGLPFERRGALIA